MEKSQGEDKKLEKIKDALVSKVEFRYFALEICWVLLFGSEN